MDAIKPKSMIFTIFPYCLPVRLSTLRKQSLADCNTVYTNCGLLDL